MSINGNNDNPHRQDTPQSKEAQTRVAGLETPPLVYSAANSNGSGSSLAGRSTFNSKTVNGLDVTAKFQAGVRRPANNN